MLSDDNEEHISDNDPLTNRKHRATTRKKRKRRSLKRFCTDATSVVALLKATFQLMKLFWDFFLH